MYCEEAAAEAGAMGAMIGSEGKMDVMGTSNTIDVCKSHDSACWSELHVQFGSAGLR